LTLACPGMSDSKPFQDHFHPRGEWVLFKRVSRKSEIQFPPGAANNEEHYDAIVVSHGPGEWQGGHFVPVEGLEPGTLILVPGNHCIQSRRWADEDLFVCPASSIICTMDPLEELRLNLPKLVVPRLVPQT
jgi:hypothetical protein